MALATIKLKSSIIKSSSHDEDHWINSKGVLGSSWWSGAVASFCRTVCLHCRSKDFGWEQEFSFRVIKNKSTRQNNHTSGFKWVKISTGNPISKCQSMVSCYSGGSKSNWNNPFQNIWTSVHLNKYFLPGSNNCWHRVVWVSSKYERPRKKLR